MSWFEWIGEVFDPQPTGTVETGQRLREYRSRTAVVICGCIALAILAGWAWVIWSVFHVQSWNWFLNCLALTGIYLAAGFFIHPWPDSENLGWFGGMMDDPFHWSDDYNRALMLLKFLLWPGRFLAESVVDMGSLAFFPGEAAPSDEPAKSRGSRRQKRSPRYRKIATPQPPPE
jgi:hypothetical protein